MSDSAAPTRKTPRTRRRALPAAPSVASAERLLAAGASLAVNEPDPDPAVTRVGRPAAGAVPSAGWFETMPDALLRFDRQLRVVYANPALERATALPCHAFVGRRLDEVEGFAAFAPLWNASLWAAVAAQEESWFKFTYPHPTGRKLFDVRLALELDGGDVTHVTATLRDVTVPHTAIRASRSADDFIESLLDTVPFGMCLLDRDLRYREWNQALEALTGVRADQVLGRRPDEVAGLAGDQTMLDSLQRMRDGVQCTPQQVEYPFGGPGGRWLRVRRTPVFDARGEFRGVFSTAEAIDRQRFAETSLAALRHALDSAGELVLEISRDGTVLDANETAQNWLGYGREQLRGMLLANLDASLSPERFAVILAQLSARGAWQGEARYRTRTGSEFPVDVVLQRVDAAAVAAAGEGGREFIFLLARDISDRKRVEAALADSAQRFRTIFEDSPVAKLLLDDRGRIEQVSHAACRLLGFDTATLRGREARVLLLDGDGGAGDSLMRSLAADGESTAAGEVRLRHRDGRLLWGRLTSRRWTATAGGPASAILVVEDTTERHTYEEQLQVMLRDHQTLLETMTVGVAQARHGRVLIANRGLARLFGYGDDDVVGLSLWDLCVDRLGRMPDETSGLPAVRSGQTTSAEVVLFRKDGEPVWCLVQARPVEADDAPASAPAAAASADPERVAEAIYTFQDISESKRQREVLSRSLLELNVVLDTTAAAVLHLQDDRVVRANAQALQLLTPEGRELIGRRFANLFADPHDYRIHGTLMRAALAAGEQYSVEVQLSGADGRPFWGLMALRATDPGNLEAGLIVSVLDIRVRKRQEEQLQALLAESQLIFDTALVGLLFVRDGRAVRANAAMEELVACEPGGLTSQIQLFAHPTDQLLVASLAEHESEIAARGVGEFELQMFRRRGDPIWVAVQGRAVNPDQPELGHIFAFVNIDERKRSERELRATLGELQLIFDNALVGMAYVADDLLIKANAATERLFGFAEADLRELQINALFARPLDWDEIRHGIAVGGAAADGLGFEHLMRRADGSTFWCAGNVRPIDAQAPERGLILALMDVDQRHRSEEELQRVRNYLDLVVENLPVLVSVREADSGRFVSLNRAGETLTGLPREQVVGRSWHEIYGRPFADLYAEMDRQALATGNQVERPRDVLLRADGRTLTVNQRVLPLFETGSGNERQARYVMSIIDDLTDEVRAETAARETEIRFRQFAENIDQLLFIATADLTAVLYVNPRYHAVVGGPPDELLDNPRAALAHVPVDDAPALVRRLPRLAARLRRLQKADFSVRIDHPARGVRLLHVRLNPVRMFDGTVRVFGVADDVTERSAAEQQRIAEAIRQRDILVREVHHRIKNNLQGVAGLLQHQASAKPELAENLNEIAGQIQAIAQVHGLQIRATGTLPVLGVAQGIFTSLTAMFGADIHVETPPPALWRWGLPENEAVPLALVINELGTNAIKHRNDRAVAVAVRFVSHADGVELQIEQPGRLKEGFDLADISSSVSGLGLVKALLPRRGAQLRIEQQGGHVMARLALRAPAIGEDRGADAA